ncbi:MAG: helix-turn-helix domain-containing protein [Candidatus Aenigmarchaeota archaeon]|nr:hypothetical protein [Candidatus Aenigmarchaeota archaeon]MDW8148982.1 helix-turn-helix domain-containing protein [Candidatus Aenigmarchaeota archaeon]
MSKELMDILRGFGLNLYERKIWMALLSTGVGTAGVLSSLSGVPRSRSYDILESLVRKGLAMIQPGRPVKFIALDPEEGLERLKKTILEKANEKIEKIDVFKKSEYMKYLKNLYKTARKHVEIEEITGTLTGRGNILNHTIKMIKEARNNLTIVTTEENLDDLIDLKSYLLDAKERGVDVRIAALVSEKAKEKLSMMGDVGTVYVASAESMGLKGNCFIMDDKEVLLPITDKKVEDSQQLAIWARSGYVVENVFKPLAKTIFESKK